MKVIVEKQKGRWEALELDAFIKEYNITPKHQGPKFCILREDGREYITAEFPNPAVILWQGSIHHIIYKGNMTQVINGVVMPNADFVPEQYVFDSAKTAIDEIKRQDEEMRGQTSITVDTFGNPVKIER